MQISKKIVTLFLVPAFLVSTQVFAQQTRVAQTQKDRTKQRAQRLWVERIQHPAHLIITRNRARDLVDAAQIALFRERLVFEVEERGTFE